MGSSSGAFSSSCTVLSPGSLLGMPALVDNADQAPSHGNRGGRGKHAADAPESGATVQVPPGRPWALGLPQVTYRVRPVVLRWRPHSSAQALQAVAHACSIARLMFAS